MLHHQHYAADRESALAQDSTSCADGRRQVESLGHRAGLRRGSRFLARPRADGPQARRAHCQQSGARTVSRGNRPSNLWGKSRIDLRGWFILCMADSIMLRDDATAMSAGQRHLPICGRMAREWHATVWLDALQVKFFRNSGNLRSTRDDMNHVQLPSCHMRISHNMRLFAQQIPLVLF